MYFLSSRRTSFNISCKEDLVAITFLGFCLPENMFTSSSLLKDNISVYGILGW